LLPEEALDFVPVPSGIRVARKAKNGNTIEEFKTFPVYKWNVDNIPWLKDI